MEPEIYQEMFNDQQRHWWFVARRKVIASILSSLELKPDARICEAGCGVGGNLALLANYGKVHAFEINQVAVIKCRSMSNADIREGSLPDKIPFAKDDKFDLIVSLDVLEHIEDDHASFAALVDQLKPEAYLLITVPAYAWMMSAHDRAHHHFRRYSKHSLLKLCENNAVEVKRIGHFNSLLFPLIATMRLVGNAVQKNRNDAGMPNAFINRMLTRIFSLEASITARWFFPFGTSLCMLVRKKA